MFPLKRLTEQAELDAENQQGERPRGRADRNGLRGGLAASYVAASVEPADRVTEWTESKNWTESTETYEAKAKCSGYGEELTA